MNILDRALTYLDLGWSVIPIAPEEKKALVKWERYQKRRPSKEEVTKWFTTHPNANIGVITGKVSGFIAIDIDSKLGREAYLSEFGEIHNTISQSTGKDGGAHLFFKHPGDREYANLARILPDVDVRGDGGYVVVAPSIHSNGRKYAWNIDPCEMGLIDLLELPTDVQTKLVSCMNQGVERPRAEEGWVQETLMGVDEGKRNEACARLAGYFLRIFEGNVDQTRIILQDWNQRNSPPLDWKEVERTLESIVKREGREELGDTVGAKIDRIQILKYPPPDSTRVYRVYVKSFREYVEMSMGDLITFARFKVKFAELTKRIPRKVGQVTWEKRVEKALGEAEEIDISADETPTGLVIRLLNFQLDPENRVSEFNYLDNRVIVHEDEIYLKIETILDALAGEKERISRKELGRILRAMSFVYERVRVRGLQFRVWHRPLDEDYSTRYM